MTETPFFIAKSDAAIPVYLASKPDWEDGIDLPEALKAQANAQAFKASSGQMVLAAATDGAVSGVLFGLGDGTDALGVAGLAAKLPEGVYKIARDGGVSTDKIAAGWADGAYRLTRYKEAKEPPRLMIGDNIEVLNEASAIVRLRSMVDTPAEDMGPIGIEAEIRSVADDHGASVSVITGDDLLAQNYPMVHAVGRAGPEAPRLVSLSWTGKKGGPLVSIVGKGVAFDTGGLNIKTGGYMRLMKKDMGGAAHALALADLVMANKLPVELKLFIPAVENSVAGNAFRPGDILQSRAGKTVEIDNTDAEGRLILGDALTRASEDDPDLLIDFATLTGAARVAVGPDLAPFYTDDETLAADIQAGSAGSGDPVWRMPLWDPYLSMLKSPIADLVNSAGSSFAGSITAALFLKQFVNAKSWVHLDVWAWREGKYGRPAGGAACGLRAMWDMLKTRYG